MKNYAKLALAGALMLAFQANAQTTNLVQTINFNLTAYEQGDTTETPPNVVQKANKISVRSQDLISLIADDLGTTFSKKAKLIVKRPAGELTGGQAFVREPGKTNVDTPIEGLTEEPVTRIFDTKFNTEKETLTGKAFTFDHVTFDAGGVSFDLTGFLTETFNTQKGKGGTFTFRSGTMKAAGTGTDSTSGEEGVPVVLTGTVQISEKEIEVEEGTP